MAQRVGWPAWLMVAAVAALSLGLIACGGDGSSEPTPTESGAASEQAAPGGETPDGDGDAGAAPAEDEAVDAGEGGAGEETSSEEQSEAAPEPESFAIQLTLGTPLELRPGPAADWGVSATLAQGTPATIVARHADDSGWLLVRGEAAEGWAPASGVAVVEEQVARLPGVEPEVLTATVVSEVVVEDPFASSEAAIVEAGEVVEVFGRNTDGSQVFVVAQGGAAGPVRREAVEVSAPVESLPAVLGAGLWVVSAEDGAHKPVGLGQLFGPEWAGDPPWLYYQGRELVEGEPVGRIFRFDPAAEEEEVVSPDSGTFVVRDDGEALVFRAGTTEDGRAQIWFTRPGAAPFLLTSQAPYQGDGLGGYLETTARWSPNGQMLLLEDAFTQPEEGEPCCPIRVVGPALGQRVVAQGSNPRWSVNDWVLFLDAEGALQRVTINGGRRFLSVEASGVWFEQAPDMTALALSRNGQNLNYVDLAQGRARLLRPAQVDTPVGGAFRSVGALWSPTSRFLAFNASETELGVYDRESDEVMLIDFGAASDPTLRQVAWSPDGMRLAYVTWEGLRVWDAESGASTLLVAGVDGHEVGWSPDGTRVSVGFGVSGRGPGDGLSARGRSTFGVYDAVSGAAVWTVRKPPSRCFVVEWSPDGAWLSVGAAFGCV